MYLPRTDEDVQPDLATATPANRGGHETNALVEDADALRLMIREILETAGYRVFEFRTPDEALEELGRREKPFTTDGLLEKVRAVLDAP